jgi:hypothetical protein
MRRLTTQSGTTKQPIRLMLAGTPFSGTLRFIEVFCLFVCLFSFFVLIRRQNMHFQPVPIRGDERGEVRGDASGLPRDGYSQQASHGVQEVHGTLPCLRMPFGAFFISQVDSFPRQGPHCQGRISNS